MPQPRNMSGSYLTDKCIAEGIRCLCSSDGKRGVLPSYAWCVLACLESAPFRRRWWAVGAKDRCRYVCCWQQPSLLGKEAESLEKCELEYSFQMYSNFSTSKEMSNKNADVSNLV